MLMVKRRAAAKLNPVTRYPPPVIYVAGPITGRPDHGVGRAWLAGRAIWKLGAVPIVPALNTFAMFDDADDRAKEIIYGGDLEILARCDAMFRLPCWRSSRGACYETAWARRLNIPIFNSLARLARWLRKG